MGSTLYDTPWWSHSDGSDRQEFQEIASIGQGNFSKVFRVKSKFDGIEYALKRSFRAVASELEAKRWQQVSTDGLHMASLRKLRGNPNAAATL